MTIKAHVPNFITLLNLLSGCIALMYAVSLNFQMAFLFVALGIFFDFFDGFFARMFNVAGPLGVELDSLADMVTSGVVPGVVMYFMLKDSTAENVSSILPFIGFIITLGSCFRLAKFNIDTRQTDSFIGLPTPANALFILSLPLVLQYSDSILITEILTSTPILIGISLFSAFILNAEIPLFSLKIKSGNWGKYKLQLFFLAVCLVLLVVLHILAVPLIILFYVLLSIINNKITGQKAG